MRKTKILFVCSNQHMLGVMARGFVEHLAGDEVEALSAALEPGEPTPDAVAVMREAGIDISAYSSPKIAAFEKMTFDLVVALCPRSGEFCTSPDSQPGGLEGPRTLEKRPLFVGAPVLLQWSVLPGDCTEEDRKPSIDELRTISNAIQDRVRGLIEDGYLAALITQKRRFEQVLDSMDDGIIVHDQNRNIFLFNRAAERITGHKREEVLGTNCHTVFHPGGLCGSQCPLSSTQGKLAGENQYEVGFRTQDGVDKQLSMRTAPIELLPEGPVGVIASFRDITEVSELRQRMKEKYSFHGMVGISRSMKEVFRTIRQLTTSDYPVLITGESGTGKELVARAVHHESRRKAGPFVPINCGALPENILESELFGHVRGAFTGAIRDKKGRFELAHQGTLFLDEVGELSPAFQVKLLRVLEEKRFEMVGGEQTISVDVRVISATNRNVKEMIEEGTFRNDLYYRLSVVPVHLPPLRERKEDLPVLIEQILENIRRDTGKDLGIVADATMDLLSAYAWPGNIRELINVLQFASVRCTSGDIQSRHLPPEIRGVVEHSDHFADRPLASQTRRNKLSIEAVEEALRRTGGNKVRAARLLGVGRATLYRFLSNHPVS